MRKGGSKKEGSEVVSQEKREKMWDSAFLKSCVRPWIQRHLYKLLNMYVIYHDELVTQKGLLSAAWDRPFIEILLYVLECCKNDIRAIGSPHKMISYIMFFVHND